MKKIFRKYPNHKSGFTIIEVIIVLAIVGLIMTIVFVAIPQAQAARRDSARKNYAGRVLVAELEYLKNNGVFPACDSGSGIPCTASDISGVTRFITAYLPEGDDPTTGDSYKSSATTSGSDSAGGSFIRTNSGTVTYYYNAGQVNHTGINAPAVGKMVLVVGHYCYSSKPDGSGNLIAGPDTDFTQIAILIGIEKGKSYCLDTYSKH